MTPSVQRFVITTTLPLLAIVAAIYVVASWFGPQYEWRQKLTVTIDTPNGVKSGSAVTEVKVYHNRIFKDGAEWQRYLRITVTVHSIRRSAVFMVVTVCWITVSVP